MQGLHVCLRQENSIAKFDALYESDVRSIIFKLLIRILLILKLDLDPDMPFLGAPL